MARAPRHDVTPYLIPFDKIDLGQELGSGGFGRVYKGTYAAHGAVAVKILQPQGHVDKKTRRNMMKEANMLISTKKHDNIVVIHGIICNNETGIYGIVTEFMAYGSLNDVRDEWEFSQLLQVHAAFQITKGMNFLHEHEPVIIHRDLKLANVLVGAFLHIKIADFGLSEWRNYSMIRLASTSIEERDANQKKGTISHIPQEAWEDFGNITKKYDVYSFAILLWELFTGETPYQNVRIMAQIEYGIMRGQRPDLKARGVDTAHPTLKVFMEKCWDQEPKKRPAFEAMMAELRTIVEDNLSKINGEIQDAVKALDGEVQDRQASPIDEQKTIVRQTYTVSDVSFIDTHPGVMRAPCDTDSKICYDEDENATASLQKKKLVTCDDNNMNDNFQDLQTNPKDCTNGAIASKMEDHKHSNGSQGKHVTCFTCFQLSNIPTTDTHPGVKRAPGDTDSEIGYGENAHAKASLHGKKTVTSDHNMTDRSLDLQTKLENCTNGANASKMEDHKHYGGSAREHQTKDSSKTSEREESENTCPQSMGSLITGKVGGDSQRHTTNQLPDLRTKYTGLGVSSEYDIASKLSSPTTDNPKASLPATLPGVDISNEEYSRSNFHVGSKIPQHGVETSRSESMSTIEPQRSTSEQRNTTVKSPLSESSEKNSEEQDGSTACLTYPETEEVKLEQVVMSEKQATEVNEVQLSGMRHITGIASLVQGESTEFVVVGEECFAKVVGTTDSDQRGYPVPDATRLSDVTRSQDHLHCVDLASSTVHVTNKTGEKVKELLFAEQRKSKEFCFVAASNDGHLYLTSDSRRSLYVCKADDYAFSHLYTYDRHSGPQTPRHLCVTIDGYVIVGDYSSGKMFVHEAEGNLLYMSALRCKRITGISCDKENMLYVLHHEPDGVSVVSLAERTYSQIIALNYYPYGLCVTDYSSYLAVGEMIQHTLHVYRLKNTAQSEDDVPSIPSKAIAQRPVISIETCQQDSTNVRGSAIREEEEPFLGFPEPIVLELETLPPLGMKSTEKLQRITLSNLPVVSGIEHLGGRHFIVLGSKKMAKIVCTDSSEQRVYPCLDAQSMYDVAIVGNTIYCVDFTTTTVHVMNKQGKKVAEIPLGFERKDGECFLLAASKSGHLYVSSPAKRSIHVCHDGKYAFVHLISYDVHNGPNRPGYMCVNSDGHLAVGDIDSGKVTVHDASGETLYTCEVQCSGLGGLCCDAEDRIFIAHHLPHGISMISTKQRTITLIIELDYIPTCLSITSDNRYFAVGEYQKGCVELYKLLSVDWSTNNPNVVHVSSTRDDVTSQVMKDEYMGNIAAIASPKVEPNGDAFLGYFEPPEMKLQRTPSHEQTCVAKLANTVSISKLEVTSDITHFEHSTKPNFVVVGSTSFCKILDAKGTEQRIYPCDGAGLIHGVTTHGKQLYCVDLETNTVHVLDKQGAKVREIPINLKRKDMECFCIAAGLDGTLYVSSPKRRIISVCPPEKKKFSPLITYAENVGPKRPGYLCTTDEGHLVVGDVRDGNVFFHDKSGMTLYTCTLPIQIIGGLACDGRNNLYIAHVEPNGISLISLRYKTISCIVDLDYAPMGLSVTKDGHHLAVGTYEHGRVELFTLHHSSEKQHDAVQQISRKLQEGTGVGRKEMKVMAHAIDQFVKQSRLSEQKDAKKVDSTQPLTQPNPTEDTFLGYLESPELKLRHVQEHTTRPAVRTNRVELANMRKTSDIASREYRGQVIFFVFGSEAYAKVIDTRGKGQRVYPCDGAGSVHSAAFYSGHLHCVDIDTLRVHVLDNMGKKVKEIPLDMQRKDGECFCIALGPRGTLFVSAPKQRVIHICQPPEHAFSPLIQYEPHSGPKSPGYMCLTQESKLVVCDINGSRLFVHRESGETLFSCRLKCNGMGGLSTDNNSRIYVAHDSPHGVSVVSLEDETCMMLIDLDYIPLGLSVSGDGCYVAVGTYRKPFVEVYSLDRGGDGSAASDSRDRMTVGNVEENIYKKMKVNSIDLATMDEPSTSSNTSSGNRMTDVITPTPLVESHQGTFLGYLEPQEIELKRKSHAVGYIVGKTKEVDLNSFEITSGITHLQHIVGETHFVVTGSQQYAKVVSLKGTTQRRYPCEGAEKIHDVAYHDNSLYYIDYVSAIVYVLNKKGIVLRKIPLNLRREKGEFFRLAVSAEGHVCVSSSKRRSVYVCHAGGNTFSTLVAYDPNGPLRPSYMCFTARGHLLVTDIDSGHIFVHDSSGEMLHTVRLPCKGVSGISCDQTDHVFAAHYSPDGVSVLSLKEQTCTNIIELDYTPQSLCVTNDGTYLAVGMYNKGRVEIYSICAPETDDSPTGISSHRFDHKLAVHAGGEIPERRPASTCEDIHQTFSIAVSQATHHNVGSESHETQTLKLQLITRTKEDTFERVDDIIDVEHFWVTTGITHTEQHGKSNIVVLGSLPFGTIFGMSDGKQQSYHFDGGQSLYDLAIDENFLYCVDLEALSVHVLNQQGEKVRDIPLGFKRFDRECFCLGIGQSGCLYVSSPKKRTIHVYHPGAVEFVKFIEYNESTGPVRPGYICTNSLGQLYVGDLDSGNIHVHEATGQLTCVQTLSCDKIWGVACDANDRIYVAHQNPNGISMTSSRCLIRLVDLQYAPQCLSITTDGHHLAVGTYNKGRVEFFTRQADVDRENTNEEKDLPLRKSPDGGRTSRLKLGGKDYDIPFLGYAEPLEVKLQTLENAMGYRTERLRVIGVSNLKVISGITQLSSGSTPNFIVFGSKPFAKVLKTDSTDQRLYPCDGAKNMFDVSIHGDVIYSVDFRTLSVHKINKRGRKIGEIPLGFKRLDGECFCLTASEDGKIFVSSPKQRRIYVCPVSGTSFTEFVAYSEYNGPGRPGYMCTDTKGRLFVGDFDSGRIFVHDDMGKTLYFCQLNCGGVWGLSRDRGNKFFVAHKHPDGVSILCPTNRTSLQLIELDRSPQCLCISRDERHLAIGMYNKATVEIYKLQTTSESGAITPGDKPLTPVRTESVTDRLSDPVKTSSDGTGPFLGYLEAPEVKLQTVVKNNRYCFERVTNADLINLDVVTGVARLKHAGGVSFLFVGGEAFAKVVSPNSSEQRRYPCLGAKSTHDIAAQGELMYYVDLETLSVHVVNIMGKKVNEIPLEFKRQGGECFCIAVSDEGVLYVSSQHKRTIHICRPSDGNFSIFTQYDQYNGPERPAYMCVTSDGLLYVGDVDNGNIFVHEKSGSILHTYKLKCKMVWGLASDEKNLVFVAHKIPHGISMVSPREQTCMRIIELDYEPLCLSVSLDSGYLAVGSYKLNRVEIFQRQTCSVEGEILGSGEQPSEEEK